MRSLMYALLEEPVITEEYDGLTLTGPLSIWRSTVDHLV